MKNERTLWLTTHLLEDEEGAQAHAAMNVLPASAREEVLEAGDRLAAVSMMAAQQYYRRAAAVRKTLGADAWREWVGLGEDLLLREPRLREAAQAFFAADPAHAGSDPLERLRDWHRLGREVAATSCKLATIFFRTTASLLHRADCVTRLSEWVRTGLSLYSQHGWQGEFLAQGFFNAAPRTVTALPPRLYRHWAGVGAALHPKLKERDILTRLPQGLQRWDEQELQLFFQCTIILAGSLPKQAYTFYRELPRWLRGVEPQLRAALLRTLVAAARRAATAVCEVAPVAAAILHQVPAAHRATALALVERLSSTCPETAIAALRSLPRAYEDADPEHVVHWFETGLQLAAGHAASALAYFGLESRTSLKVLHTGSTAVTLDECQGVLRKYVQMMSGSPASFSGSERFELLPPIEEFPAENEVSLPLRIDLLDSHEDNFRLYRFLAAQLAGRREFGTYGFVPPSDNAPPSDSPGRALWAYLNAPDQPALLEELFLLAEGVRVHERLCAAYGALRSEGKWVATRVLQRWHDEQNAPARVADVLFAMLLTNDERDCPPWVDLSTARLVARLVIPLAMPSATVQDSMEIARQLAAALAKPTACRFAHEFDSMFYDPITGETFLDPDFHDEHLPAANGQAEAAPASPAVEPFDNPLDRQLALSDEEEGGSGGLPISPEELQRLLASGAKLKISQGFGEAMGGLGLYITDLLGKVPKEQLDQLRKLLGDSDPRPSRPARPWQESTEKGPCFYYDEWDYHIGDYRSRWCRLRELTLEGDSGEFFHRAVLHNAGLIPEVRRQFQRIRPETYRVIRGLEDGEDFDLNAAIDARIDRRARRSPSSKLYVARQREERDVATLFLVDMSASTDEQVGPASRLDAPRRVIDITKEALIIMAAALEEIGDAYAIYGFSGHGRQNVEMYRVKSFSESLGPDVKGRIGGIQPRRGTRMGTALRHVIEKMAAVTARSKHMFLLSDGFPQDHDYGQDRRSNIYGIRDTSVALREVEAAGIIPFCITVDKAGHDYLREMCDESRYMVIEDIKALPRELPKIYQRIVRI